MSVFEKIFNQFTQQFTQKFTQQITQTEKCIFVFVGYVLICGGASIYCHCLYDNLEYEDLPDYIKEDKTIDLTGIKLLKCNNFDEAKFINLPLISKKLILPVNEKDLDVKKFAIYHEIRHTQQHFSLNCLFTVVGISFSFNIYLRYLICMYITKYFEHDADVYALRKLTIIEIIKMYKKFKRYPNYDERTWHISMCVNLFFPYLSTEQFNSICESILSNYIFNYQLDNIDSKQVHEILKELYELKEIKSLKIDNCIRYLEKLNK